MSAIYGAAPKVTTLSIIPSQVNVSSIGSTYTDSVGNTYGEATAQTRLTASGSQRQISCRISWHTNANTASRQIFNVTDAAALGAVDTTSSTTEVTGLLTSSFLSTNNGDLITIQLKNSTAGNVVTIDDGGMMETDSAADNITATGNTSIQTLGFNGVYPSSVSIALLRCLSTATATMQLNQNSAAAVSEALSTTPVGATFGTAQANTVFTRVPTIKSNSVFAINTSALSASGYVVGISLQLSADQM